MNNRQVANSTHSVLKNKHLDLRNINFSKCFNMLHIRSTFSLLGSFYLTFPNFEKYVTVQDGPKCLNLKGYHVRCRGIIVLKLLRFFFPEGEAPRKQQHDIT
jgi:hypothetical protein